MRRAGVLKGTNRINHGWKLAYVNGSPDPAHAKRFNQSNNPNWPSLRPKLTIIYGSP